jgi:hypothetical protein
VCINIPPPYTKINIHEVVSVPDELVEGNNGTHFEAAGDGVEGLDGRGVQVTVDVHL